MKCNHRDCEKSARWRPVLLLFAEGYYNAPPAEAELGLLLCEEHKDEIKVEHLVTDEGWRQIVDGFRVAGKAKPDRNRILMKFKPIH